MSERAILRPNAEYMTHLDIMSNMAHDLFVEALKWDTTLTIVFLNCIRKLLQEYSKALRVGYDSETG